MKKRYLIKLKQRKKYFYQLGMDFFGKRAHDGIELTRLTVFLVFSLLAIIGLPLHFAFNIWGDDQAILDGISFSVWMSSLILLLLYIYNKVSLSKAFFTSAVITQLLEGLGIVYMAATAQGSFTTVFENIVLNEAVCFTVFLITCMGLLKNAPTWLFAIYLASLGMAYAINPTVVASQFTIIFAFVMACIWLYMIALRIFIGNTSHELSDYKQLQDSILDMFGMSKVEMVTLVQICRKAESSLDLNYSKVGKLSRRTRDNLILLGEYLYKEKSDKLSNLGEIFPQLTPTELEVCNLVIKGMTLKEIAVATNKRMGNIGTVRGNIRKKLGLDSGDDLREALVQRVKG